MPLPRKTIGGPDLRRRRSTVAVRKVLPESGGVVILVEQDKLSRREAFTVCHGNLICPFVSVLGEILRRAFVDHWPSTGADDQNRLRVDRLVLAEDRAVCFLECRHSRPRTAERDTRLQDDELV